MSISSSLRLTVLAAFLPASLWADNFGSGGNVFTIDFVTVAATGNPDDTGGGGATYSSPYGGVAYTFRMGTYEITQAQIDAATAGGLTNVTAGAHAGNKPAANITWYEAAAFVNWLNESTGHQKAYNLNGTATGLTLWSDAESWDNNPGLAEDLNHYRHKNAYYFLPSEDEWYKAAYHQQAANTANYWDYATGSNTAPTGVASGSASGTAIFGQTFAQGPAVVTTSGGASAYGTRGQNGNVFEWQESSTNGLNDSAGADRVIRGGNWSNPVSSLRPTTRFGVAATTSATDTGFRVASIPAAPVPEPSTTALLLTAAVFCAARRRRS